MNQSGSSIQNENLQEFIDSAANALDKGQQQFFTPRTLAQALCRPLPAMRREMMLDLSFGSGNLAAAAGSKQAIGIDIDNRVTRALTPPDGSKWEVIPADLTHWYPLAAEAGFTAPFILINPPFSLKWHASRIAEALGNSATPEISATAARFGEHVDSTLASFLIALDLLPYNGEGFIVCNSDTARRFFGNPTEPDTTAPHSNLRKFIWMWLEIPGTIYENQKTKFDTAVLYFSKTHGIYNEQPLHLVAPSSDPLAVERTIMTPEAFNAVKGRRITHEHEARPNHTLDTFQDIAAEYAVRHRGKRPAWNIRLNEKGHIVTYLTPFQRTSKKICRTLLTRLNCLNGHSPMSLCVTATSRTALREAVECGVWKVEPAMLEAVSRCLDEYAREGAPFYQPNEVQALGWIDEHGQLECKADGIGSFVKGHKYQIRTTIEETTWKAKKINLSGEPESLSYSGKELLVSIDDPTGCTHHFHVRKDEEQKPEQTDKDGNIKALHHHVNELVKHFLIPIPKDIATLRPIDYQANLDRLGILESIINTRLAAA